MADNQTVEGWLLLPSVAANPAMLGTAVILEKFGGEKIVEENYQYDKLVEEAEKTVGPLLFGSPKRLHRTCK